MFFFVMLSQCYYKFLARKIDRCSVFVYVRHGFGYAYYIFDAVQYDALALADAARSYRDLVSRFKDIYYARCGSIFGEYLGSADNTVLKLEYREREIVQDTRMNVDFRRTRYDDGIRLNEDRYVVGVSLDRLIARTLNFLSCKKVGPDSCRNVELNAS